MHGDNLVAVYNTQSQAEAVRGELLRSGFGQDDVRLSSSEGELASDRTSASGQYPRSSQSDGGFLDWLFGSGESDRDWYQSNLSDGRTAVSVYARDASQAEIGERILESHNPIDIDASATSGMTSGSSRSGSGMTSDTQSARGATAGQDEVIPIVKEELNVGKQVEETRRRVRSYVVDRPVEEQINLRDENVVIERRPVTDGGRVDPGALQEREFEVIERHERPVVNKQARTVEEVVVHKDQNERVENVRDTVRETEIAVDESEPSIGSKRDTASRTQKPKL